MKRGFGGHDVTCRLGSLLDGCRAKRHTKPKSGRRKDLSLVASKENTGDLSQSSVSVNNRIGEVLSQESVHIHEGA